MKTLFSTRNLLALALLVAVSSCRKSGNAPSTLTFADPNVYATVQYGSTGFVWNAGKLIAVAPSVQLSYVNSIYFSGNDMYVTGSLQTGKGNFLATYWKNGVLVYLPNNITTNDTTGTQSGNPGQIVVSGNDVYVAGYLVYSYDTAVYWKNGIINYLAFNALAGSINVSGNDVYVGGWQWFDGLTAAYWKNGVFNKMVDSGRTCFGAAMYAGQGGVYMVGRTVTGGDQYAGDYWLNGTLTHLTGSGESSSATSIFVSGSDVYISGTITTGGTQSAVYWKNGSPVILTGAGITSGTNTIFVSGTDVYVGGFVQYSKNNQAAALWKNGALVLLTDDAFSNAQVNCIWVK